MLTIGTANEPVEYCLPLRQHYGDVARFVGLTLISAMICLIGAVLIASGLGAPDAGIAAAAGAGLVVAPTFAVLAARGRVGRVIVLDESCIHRGRGPLRREFHYDHVQLVAIDRSHAGEHCRCVSLRDGLRLFRVWLPPDDAGELVQQLRRRCLHAGFIDEEGREHAPMEEALPGRAKTILAAEWRRRAWWHLAMALVLVLGAPLIVLTVLWMLPNLSAPLVIIAVAVPCLLAFVRLNYHAAQHWSRSRACK